MIFEFMENGDLADFLRKNDPAVLGGKRKQRLTLVSTQREIQFFHLDLVKNSKVSDGDGVTCRVSWWTCQLR